MPYYFQLYGPESGVNGLAFCLGSEPGKDLLGKPDLL